MAYSTSPAWIPEHSASHMAGPAATQLLTAASATIQHSFGAPNCFSRMSVATTPCAKPGSPLHRFLKQVFFADRSKYTDCSLEFGSLALNSGQRYDCTETSVRGACCHHVKMRPQHWRSGPEQPGIPCGRSKLRIPKDYSAKSMMGLMRN